MQIKTIDTGTTMKFNSYNKSTIPQSSFEQSLHRLAF